MNEKNIKIIKEQWPICFDCRALIMIKGFIISDSNELMLQYSCSCPVEMKTKSLHKYLYGLDLLQGLGHSIEKCQCHQLLSSYFCIGCCEHLCLKCYPSHKLHLLSRYLFEYDYPICKEHNSKILYMCLRCSLGICDKCTSHIKHNYKDYFDYYSLIEGKMVCKYNMNGSKVVKEMIKGKNIKLSKENEDDLIKLYTILCDLLRKTVHYPNMSIPLSLNNFTNISIRKRSKVKFNKIPILKGPLTVIRFNFSSLSKNDFGVHISNESASINKIVPLGNKRFIIHLSSFIRGPGYVDEPPDNEHEVIGAMGVFSKAAIIFDNFFLKLETIKSAYEIQELVDQKGKFLFNDWKKEELEIVDCNCHPMKSLKKCRRALSKTIFAKENLVVSHYVEEYYINDFEKEEIIKVEEIFLLGGFYLTNDTFFYLSYSHPGFFNFITKVDTPIELNIPSDIEDKYYSHSFSRCFTFQNKIIIIKTEDTYETGLDIIYQDETNTIYNVRNFRISDITSGFDGYLFYSSSYEIITIDIENGDEITYIETGHHNPSFEYYESIHLFSLGYGYYLYSIGDVMGLYVLD